MLAQTILAMSLFLLNTWRGETAALVEYQTILREVNKEVTVLKQRCNITTVLVEADEQVEIQPNQEVFREGWAGTGQRQQFEQAFLESARTNCNIRSQTWGDSASQFKIGIILHFSNVSERVPPATARAPAMSQQLIIHHGRQQSTPLVCVVLELKQQRRSAKCRWWPPARLFPNRGCQDARRRSPSGPNGFPIVQLPS